MELKRHHKIIIGSVSSLLILFMLVTSVFTYMIFIRQSAADSQLDKKITNLQSDTQAKFNQLTESILKTEDELKTLGSQIGSIDQQITTLKASASSDFSSVIEKAIESVVTVRTDISQGSGFFIANQGYVVTNAHIFDGARAAGIITYDGKMHDVSLIGTDTNLDIILLKIADTSYKPLILADSDSVQVGEKVIAIGNPLGLQFSASEGIISAIHRGGENGLKAYIQTDAALNPGNSGGPLIDINGEVVGINNYKLGGSENIGFALESNYIKSAVNDIARTAIRTSLI